MFMSQHQTTGQSHYTEVTKKALGKVAKLKYLGKMLTYLNCIHEKIKSRISLGNACYHAVQNLLSCLLSENIKIKIYKTIILNVLFFQNRMLRSISGPNKVKLWDAGENCMKKLHNLYASPCIIGVKNSRMRWEGNVAHTRDEKCLQNSGWKA
jgi:hypothetical protein